MAKLVGVWILGDTLKDLVYTVKNTDGTARDLTAATVNLEGRRHNDVNKAINRSGVVDGDQVGAGKGKVTFSDLTNGLSLGNARHQKFECRVKVVQSAKTGYTNPFDVIVEQWP